MMNRVVAVVAAALLSAASTLVIAETTQPSAPPVQQQQLQANVLLDGGQVVLPNAWKISPAGKATKLPGDMPERMIFVGGGKYLLVNTGGYNEHGIAVLDAATGQLLHHVKVPRTFVGMCADAKGETIYLSGGSTMNKSDEKEGAAVRRFHFADGHLTEETPLAIQGLVWKKSYIGGLAMSSDGALFVANLHDDCVYRVKPDSGAVLATAKVGYRPCSIAISLDGKTLAVANWGDATVSLVDPQTMKERSRVKVGSHPADLLWRNDGRLFVANAGTNTVSVIAGTRVIENIRTSLEPKAPIGSTPIALASSGDKLYIANADNNNVAVVDVEERNESRVLGFIPTGWYPSALAASNDGKTLYIGTAKGMTFAPNAKDKKFIGTILTGHVSLVDAPDEKQLSTYTRQVLNNTPAAKKPAELTADERRMYDQTFSRIKHVLYIIKENRTYDQVFGDIPEGNGDAKLAMFGERITPNAHKMARQWVLLDNLYCNGEVSQDGHVWCDGAYASDFTVKAWEQRYSGRLQPDADDRLTRSPGGYIWDQAIARGLTFRTYGEREAFVSSPETAPQVTNDRMRSQWVSKEWSVRNEKDARDYELADVFVKEMREAEKSGNWPNLMTMSLNENHTHGLWPGANTPEACVGSNDLGLGKIVEAVTHSKFWPTTAIFVIEDDAQNGHDHVDAHRTIGLVISPYTRRHIVDSTMYTPASYLRTMELMLKLPPMTQFDAAATPMVNSFMHEADLTPYDAVPVNVDLAAKNPEKGEGAKASMELDFSEIDAANADAAKFNTILWNHFFPGEPEPAPVRSMVLVR